MELELETEALRRYLRYVVGRGTPSVKTHNFEILTLALSGLGDLVLSKQSRYTSGGIQSEVEFCDGHRYLISIQEVKP